MNIPVPQFKLTRLAPTPSGYLHMGNALAFAITAALARKAGAEILLRIDDLDRPRVNHLYVQDIFDTLNFLEIPWDRGPRNMVEYNGNWSQLKRMDSYSNALQQLKDNGQVFACKCSRAQLQSPFYPDICRDKALPLDTPDTAWRLFTDGGELTMNTLNQGLVKTVLPTDMKDFIVRKKDGYPAYQLASLIDDIHFAVDFIVRGQDLYSSTLAQHYLGGILKLSAFKNITFYHHPLLLEAGNKKLSKSAGATSIKYLREQGCTAFDVYQAIGKMLGSNEDLRSFESFASLI